MKKIPFQRSLPKGVFTLLCAVAFIAGALTSHAADSSWNVDAAGNWSTAGSWTAGVPGSTSILNSTDIATFGFTLTAARTVTVDANRNIGGITFGNTSNFGFTLSSGNLLLTNGGVIQNLSGTGNHTNTISSAITIQGNGGSATFTANATSGTSLLSIANVSGVSTAGNTTTLNLNGSNTATGNVVGILTNGTSGGKLAIVKSGAGTWSLGLANTLNTFTGGITINAGTLRATTAAGGRLSAQPMRSLSLIRPGRFSTSVSRTRARPSVPSLAAARRGVTSPWQTASSSHWDWITRTPPLQG